jgi:peptide/nickel transport system permease protein
MPPIASFLFRRLAFVVVTIFLSTLLLYGVICTIPPQARAMLYFSKNPGKNFNENNRAKILDDIIIRNGLNDPFPLQYIRWLGDLVRGDWGWSPTAGEEVLPALLRLIPATAELTLYSVLVFIPLGIISGVLASVHANHPPDHIFRLTAFIASSLPPFVLGIVLLALFYVSIHWFPPGRLDDSLRLFVLGDGFIKYTGLITIDGLLNGRLDIFSNALRHLALPVITLSAVHWSTLARITRVVMTEERQKEYIIAARARGIPDQRVIWRHALRNALVPAINSSLLSAASLITGVLIVESIFSFPGVSRFMRNSLIITPDVPAALGFSIFTIIVVLLYMIALDILQALADPRHREGTIHQ